MTPHTSPTGIKRGMGSTNLTIKFQLKQQQWTTSSAPTSAQPPSFVPSSKATRSTGSKKAYQPDSKCKYCKDIDATLAKKDNRKCHRCHLRGHIQVKCPN